MPPEEPLVLGFDTSSEFCTAAIIRGSLTVASRNEKIGRGHDERLFPLIEALLNETGIDWKDLAAIGTGTGPGNFTGTRISVAAARGLSMSLGIPAVGVSRFAALRLGISEPVLASVDAGRRQVFLQRAEGSAPCVQHLDEIRCENPPDFVVGHESKRIAASLGIKFRKLEIPAAVAIARVAASRMHASPPPPAPIYNGRQRDFPPCNARMPLST
ncbi:MAG: tRNA (adenosine(37)-N6)-threonylcarbamoyltransferase complex dimerization subunit type 1 TsaB [Albidovulum sp.]|nr:tRNA (adenosine(37)-N6)-threonylcarbamoyltransferase complex dimerization subunit type 1 TsaB [Albidovulum sp.]MDE0533975.1 tRNA (adenosine(37)-N6)-threonylcarbamoyltransferase complex dimerization subunit type 1 TsaB [Albidovulum sp.]